jgi:hypothetical protein
VVSLINASKTVPADLYRSDSYRNRNSIAAAAQIFSKQKHPSHGWRAQAKQSDGSVEEKAASAQGAPINAMANASAIAMEISI